MNRRKFAQAAVLAGAGIVCLPRASRAADAAPGADFFALLEKRHSSRAYTDEAVSKEDIEKMLRAAMLAPSAANEQPWEFVVITDKSLLSQVGPINSWAKYAKDAPLGILVCLNQQKEKEKGMGIIDIGICSENILLAATALGLGSVFTGIYPYKDRMEGFSKLCKLPEYIEPVGLILIGHPKVTEFTRKERFNSEAIHYNTWDGAQ